MAAASATTRAQHQEGRPPLGGGSLRAAFAQLPTGVTVVTTVTGRGPAGMTASAVCSLSLDPPLVLFCAVSGSRTLARIRERRAFLVNVLPADAADTARAFAAAGTTPETRFGTVAWHPYEQLPALDGALAWIACSLDRVHPGGDHTIVVGRAVRCGHQAGEPLVRHAGSFRRLS